MGNPDPAGRRMQVVRQALGQYPHIKGLFWECAARVEPLSRAHEQPFSVTNLRVPRRSYASLYQNPPGGMRTLEEDEAFIRALSVMADVYASAVGTTVLQIKEIPPRPEEFDGALCIFGQADGADEAAIREAFCSFGDIKPIDFASGVPVIRFASHIAAIAANKADKPELCEGLDLLYNERSYDGRIDDSSGRDDDSGRGWCASHANIGTVLVLSTGPSPSSAPTGAALRTA